MTITLGWWLIPTIISIVSLAWLAYEISADRGGYAAGLPAMFAFGIGGIASLASWLVWSLA